MKKKRGLTIKINFSNRWLYTFIVLGILAVVAVGVYAYGTSTPSTFGHSIEEIDFSEGMTISSGGLNVSSGNLIVSSGRLGVGTQTPSYTLDVLGNSRINGGLGVSNGITIDAGGIGIGNVVVYSKSSSTNVACNTYCSSGLDTAGICLGAWAAYNQITTCASNNGRNCLCAKG